VAGVGHEKVPGADRPPLIGVRVEEGVCGAVLIVQGFKENSEVFRLRCRTRSEAEDHERDLRYELAHAPKGNVEQVLLRWKRVAERSSGPARPDAEVLEAVKGWT
jgi:hypothetical protein